MGSEEELKDKIEKLENRIDELDGEKAELEEEKGSGNEDISRRDFLKKAGAGAAGLGALALTPASALQIKTSNPITYNGNSVWHEGNDGVNSGLEASTAGNADKVDGMDADQLGGMDKNQKALFLANL